MDTLKPLPWAAALYEKRKDNLGSDSPSAMCLPDGPRIDAGVGKIVQTPLLLMLSSGTSYREIHMDGRELPQDPNPDWMGYSVGHWEGDTLVIESNGFNDRTWIDGGHPHTEALRLTERLAPSRFRTSGDYQDPCRPWRVRRRLDGSVEIRARCGHRRSRVRLQRERTGPPASGRQGIGREERFGCSRDSFKVRRNLRI